MFPIVVPIIIGGAALLFGGGCDHGVRLVGDYDAGTEDEADATADVSIDAIDADTVEDHLDDRPLDDRPDIMIDTIDADGFEEVIGECEIGSIRQSYSGPPETEGVGVCRPQIEECQGTEEDAWYRIIQEEVLPLDEICNDELDNDCDGIADYAKVGIDKRITVGAVAHWWSPSLVWNGTGYGVSWEDFRDGNGEIYFARIDAVGNKIGDDVRISDDDPAWSGPPSLVWTGSEYGATWRDERSGRSGIYFTRVSSDGVTIGSNVSITNAGASSPSLVWNGTGYGVSWSDYRYGYPTSIYFARLNADGVKIGEDTRITDPTRVSAPSLVWNGTEYGLSWSDKRDGENPEIYFSRIDASAIKIGEDVRITFDPAWSDNPSLVWTGSGYGVSWWARDGLDYTTDEIYFARLDSNGIKIGSDVRITHDPNQSVYPSLVWDGIAYGVSWTDNRSGYPEVYFTRINADGNEIGDDVRISDDPAWSGLPSLVWNGTEYGVSWMDEREGNPEIYFARIGCN